MVDDYSSSSSLSSTIYTPRSNHDPQTGAVGHRTTCNCAMGTYCFIASFAAFREQKSQWALLLFSVGVEEFGVAHGPVYSL